MPKPKSSLKDQLSSLLDPTPDIPDYDPEDFERDDLPDDSGSNGDSGDDLEAQHDAREHYVKVGKSQIRKRQDLELNDPKYVGTRVNRQDLFAESDVSDNNEEEQEEEYGDSDDDALGDDSGVAELTDSSDDEHDESDNSNESYSSEGESDEEEELDELGFQVDRKSENSVKQQLEVLEKEENHILKLMSQSAKVDVLKGQHVLKQTKMWDALLDVRIRTQKVVTTANCFPSEETGKGLETLPSKLIGQIQHKVFSVLDELLDLRTELWQRMTDDSKITTETLSKKRKRWAEPNTSNDSLLMTSFTPSDDITKALWADIQSTTTSFQSYRNQVLEKWSNKVQIASGLPLNKKLKAFNQGILHQTEQILQDQDRLVKRTQLKRAQYDPLAPTSADRKDDSTAPASPLSSNNNNKEYHVEVFDDHDFYQQLLRELIENRTELSDDPVALGKRWVALKHQQADQDRQRRKATVDTKASKGRRLRYHVHDKLQSFMVPMPDGSWHEEMKDELFTTLLGKRTSASSGLITKQAHTAASGADSNGMMSDQAVGMVNTTDGFSIFG
ncbi:rRNA-processing protein bfr2 [Dispira simplex]|nr:rRNA-processing protein bfr2 [Dispira simplex]